MNPHYLRSGITQLAYVTNDIAHAEKVFSERLGIERFLAMPSTTFEEQHFHGRPSAIYIDVALAWTGSIFVELIKPITEDSPYTQLIQPNGFTLACHHVGVNVENWEVFSKQFIDSGNQFAFDGRLGDAFRFGYWDATSLLGHYVEFIVASPAGQQILDNIKHGKF